MSQPNDVAAERATLAGLWRYGSSIYYDICDIIGEATFTVEDNANLYSIIKDIFTTDDTVKIDLAAIESGCKKLKQKLPTDYLRAIASCVVNESNVRKFAAKIRKLEIARLLKQQLDGANNELSCISGDEPILQILNLAEDAVLNFTSLLNDDSKCYLHLGKECLTYLEFIADNPVAQMGISTGFPILDAALGGGLRKGTVNVFGARAKQGKTTLAENMIAHIISQVKIPALNCDTEMGKNDHINKILGNVTSINVTDIETGKQNIKNNPKLKEKAIKFAELPYFYRSIAGVSFEDQLAIMRRWIMNEVGLNDDGSAKDCVIFYDYLKLMTAEGLSNDMKEYQMLGFMMTALHNFTVRYQIPIVMFLQLTREGIDKETTAIASGSDRIVWLCSNFSILKRKSPDEIAEDGIQNGNTKIVVLATRHGPGLEDGDYINCHYNGGFARITEGLTRSELQVNKGKNTGEFVDNNDKDDIPFEE